MISVIIPCLNEEKALPATLANVFRQAGEYEIIVVDGGSTDRSCETVRNSPNVKLVRARCGRARQMNAGADVARGDWLLFLHADTLLPENALLRIASLSSETDVQAGCFHQKFSGGQRSLQFISRLHNWRCNRTRIIYGDQAMFVRRTLFHRLGGFPDRDILEDVLFSEKLLQATRPLLLNETVITDSRKFVQRGIFRCFAEVAIILICYELRLPIMAPGFFSPVR
ncbi:MAG: TIGR04283 family arsenosugar biosynthesis glycosyltransferase [Gammaproteobacteria bacterium]